MEKYVKFGSIVLLAIVLFGCGQRLTPEEERAISAALAQVNAIDSGDYVRTWDAAPAFLKESIEKAQWVERLTYLRKPVGQIQARKFREIRITNKVPGAKQEGRYAVVTFGASFDRKKTAVEVVTLAHVPQDGQWKMAGYTLLESKGRLPEFIRKVIAYIKSFGRNEKEAVEEAVVAGLKWLNLMDGGQADQTWDTAGYLLREMTDRDQWGRFVSGFRNELGAVKSRELKDAAFTQSLPGAPDGLYVIIHYDTSFENKESAVERLVLTQHQNETWQTAGYFITEVPGTGSDQQDFDPFSETAKPAEGKTEVERIGAQAQTGWLEMLDQGDYPYCWQMGSTLLQAVTSEKNFTDQMEFIRKPLGKVVSRILKKTSHTGKLLNAPDGEYVVALYETAFQDDASIRETVISRKDRDGQWRVSGYFIKQDTNGMN